MTDTVTLAVVAPPTDQVTLAVVETTDQVTLTVATVDTVTLTVGNAIGPPGPAGSSGGSNPQVYTFTNAATWTIPHNLGRYPAVQLVDSTGAVFDADVELPDLHTAVVTHSQPVTGSALIS